MEIIFAATLILIMIVINAETERQRRNSLCQQEVRIIERFARKK